MEEALYMSDLSVDFCGLLFKNPVIVSSIEPTNSLARLKQCIDAGAAGAVVKTLTDIPVMNTLTRNAKYAILNENGNIIKGKVPRNYVFYSRSGFAKEAYRDWAPYLKAAQAYADQSKAHIIASVGAGSLDRRIYRLPPAKFPQLDIGAIKIRQTPSSSQYRPHRAFLFCFLVNLLDIISHPWVT